MSGDISKLPKWAQKHIERLQRNLEDARRSNAAMQGKLEGGCSGKVYRRDLMEEFKLPDDGVYCFNVGGSIINVSIREEHGGDVLNISGYNRTLEIEPRASNSIYLRLKK